MGARDSQPRSTAPFQQLFADVVLWLLLVLLFFAFRIALFWIFHGESSQLPTTQAFVRCFETGMRSDTCAAMWALLPSLALTIVGFAYPLGVWHQRIRRITLVVALSLCAIIFIADVGYFAEYDNQFDHWIFGLIYDDRAAIFETIWKSHHVVLLIIVAVVAVGIVAWLFNKILRQAESADLPDFLGTKTARVVTVIVVAIWVFIGARVW